MRCQQALARQIVCRLCRAESPLMPCLNRRVTRPDEQLKHYFPGEKELPFAAESRPSPGQVQRAGDNPELGGVRDIDARIIIMRRVRHTEHLHSELEFHTLGDLDVAKEAGIHVEEARPSDEITARGAEAYLTRRNSGERTRVEVMTRHVRGSTAYAESGYRCGSNAAQDIYRANLIRCLVISRRVELSTSPLER